MKKHNITNKRYYLKTGEIMELRGIGFRLKHNKVWYYPQNLNSKYRKFKAFNIKDVVKIENL